MHLRNYIAGGSLAKLAYYSTVSKKKHVAQESNEVFAAINACIMIDLESLCLMSTILN